MPAIAASLQQQQQHHHKQQQHQHHPTHSHTHTLSLTLLRTATTIYHRHPSACRTAHHGVGWALAVHRFPRADAPAAQQAWQALRGQYRVSTAISMFFLGVVLDHLSTHFAALHHLTRAVGSFLRSAHAYRMVICACNPMCNPTVRPACVFRPAYVFRHLRSESIDFITKRKMEDSVHDDPDLLALFLSSTTKRATFVRAYKIIILF